MDLRSSSSPLCVLPIRRLLGVGLVLLLAALVVRSLEFIGLSFALARSPSSALFAEGGRLEPCFPALAGAWLLPTFTWTQV